MKESHSYEFHTDICVIGAGHAGCEAALACARLGFDTVIFTMNVDSIALMPCNPHIGGSSKGHLVREIDALGGEMGKAIDHTFLQSRMLNQSKGPAVHSLRAQADKAEYSRYMRKTLENQEHLVIRQDEVVELLTVQENRENDSVPIADPMDSKMAERFDLLQRQRLIGVRTDTGTRYACSAAILCTGTYLNARCLIGECIKETGPSGMQRATYLSENLRNLGLRLRRFKTGTPARMDGRTLDYSKMTIQSGDEKVVPFSFSTNPDDIQPDRVEQLPCWLTYTNEKTHDIIRDNLDRSPIYSGIIEGTGPRYCPSIEDKVVKFPEKERHQVFIEPEGRFTNEVYVDGMSSSMPDDVQQKMYRTVPGLEHCTIVKNAYAIEYDCLDANELNLSLETKRVKGLFCAGQLNGSSGYEEAAAQGLMAGINAVMELKGLNPIILKRSEAYIGVLIDDLVTKENREPYRMMTSRAEYRLLLRQDNADLRLRGYGYRAGLVSRAEYDHTCAKEAAIKKEIKRLHSTKVGASATTQAYLTSIGSTPLKTAASLAELLSRPEMTYEKLNGLDAGRPDPWKLPPLTSQAILSKDMDRNSSIRRMEDIDDEATVYDGECSHTITDSGDNLSSIGDSKFMDFMAERPWVRDEIIEQVEIQIKYEGYIERQQKQVDEFNRLENKKIPNDIDYTAISSLRLEARQKLTEARPSSIGQASRMAGVTPADVAVLLVYLEKQIRGKS